MDFGISPEEQTKLFPPFSPDIKLIEAIESAIRLAWERTKKRIDVNKAKEPEITAYLEVELINIHQSHKVADFCADICETPVRGEEHQDFTGEKIEVRPDIKIAIRSGEILGHRKYHAYFIECKIVSDTNSVTNYADEGLKRFPDGKYAWSMTCAGMLGYVRPDSECDEPEPSLNAYFDKPGFGPDRRRKQKLKEGLRQAKGASGIIETMHDRSFKLRDEMWIESEKMAGPITVRHLWLPLG